MMELLSHSYDEVNLTSAQEDVARDAAGTAYAGEHLLHSFDACPLAHRVAFLSCC